MAVLMNAKEISEELGISKTLAYDIMQIYLYYYFLSEQERIRKFDRGSGQPSIRKTDILAMEIDIPDIKTQKKIAAILRGVDEKIESNNCILSMKVLMEALK